VLRLASAASKKNKRSWGEYDKSYSTSRYNKRINGLAGARINDYSI
jgi:hypothetical protein